MARPSVRLVELRVLEGPNLYVPRPAVKLTLDVSAWLRAEESRAAALARPLGIPASLRPGPPGSEERRRFAVRVASRATRELARAGRTRLAVRARAGEKPEEVVVGYPWRRRGTAEALGNEVVELLRRTIAGRSSFDRLLREAGDRLSRIDPGPAPAVPSPTIPVIAVTGTNGKTSTVRLLAHLLREAGRSVAFTTTDGVYHDGRLVEEGDYSGPAGAATAFEQDADAAVLEVARGGILLKGIGTAHLDVAVVTNVSADHLGLHGISTVDQLAEVKAAITRITRADGWTVLNADDPRVLAMRDRARGRPFLFSMDPDHPAIRAALGEGGRALAPLDGSLVLFSGRGSVHPLLALEDIPMTLAGISSQHVQNAMAATAAALGVGLGPEEVVRGLRTFVLDPEQNPGRANLFEVDGRVVVIDYAHNEAGMQGLVEISRGLRAPGAAVWMGFGSAGDRSDEILHGMAYIGARGADHVVLIELLRYLRGRSREEIVDRLRAGAEDGGATDIPLFETEVEGLTYLLDQASPNDVVAVTALGERPEVFQLLEGRGATRVGAERCRELVRRARGDA